MKFRLVGTDFQSWKNFDLKVDGFTMIVGSSNRGKSAIIRSLRGILRNQVQAAFIRHGQKSAELTIEVEKGPKATLSRSKTTTYQVNGQDYAKLDGDVPQPIKDLNVHQIQVGSTKLDPTFAGQFDSQFMMDLSPADLNSVFGLFSNTERLNQGKKAIGSSNIEINSQAKLLASEIQNGNIKIAAIEELEAELADLKPDHDRFSQNITSLQTVQTLIQAVIKASSRVGSLRAVSSTVIPTTQTLQDLVRQGRVVQQIRRVRKVLDCGKSALSSVPDSEAWRKYTSAWSLLSQYKSIKSRMSAAPKFTPVNTDKLKELVDLRSRIGQWWCSSLEVARLTAQHISNSQELDKLRQQVNDLTKDLIECPKCGHQFTKE